MDRVDLSMDYGELIKRLISLSDDLKKDSVEIMAEASKPFIDMARSLAPRSEYVHYRYSTPKLSNKLKAPKGKGVKVATYRPGNLAYSIKYIKFRRMNGVVVGPLISKNHKGTFGPSYEYNGSAGSARSDGWYAHMVEFGTSKTRAIPFMRPAWDAKQSEVIRIAGEQIKLKLIKYESKV